MGHGLAISEGINKIYLEMRGFKRTWDNNKIIIRTVEGVVLKQFQFLQVTLTKKSQEHAERNNMGDKRSRALGKI